MRHLIIFLSIALLGNATAQTFGLYTYVVNPDNVSVTITDYPTDATGAIEIPAIIDGRSVTSIGSEAFRDCTGLTSVTIGNSVTSIATSSFIDCTNLTSIVVAVDNLNYSSIGPLLLNKNGTVLIAGAGVSGDFTIPDSVTSIGNQAFWGCSDLTSVTIGDSVTSIGFQAFKKCSGLTSITIPDSVTSIGDYAFQECTGLTSVTIGDSITSIGNYAFYQCTNLASILLEPMAAPTVGFNAFLNLSAAAIIYYPLGATGYAASYGGVPTAEGPPPDPESPVLDIGDFYESSAGVSVVVSAIPTAGYPTNFSYQWYFNGFTIPSTLGGTASSLTLDGSSDSNGTWRVVVTNDGGSTEASFEYRVFTDSDSDGLSDYRESNITNTNPSLADTDSDGLNDFVELNTTLTDPNDSDSDDDTLLDGAEVNTYGSDPKDTDSDDDGLLDAAEVNTYSTSPIDADSDNDTLTDSQEVLTYFTNPNLADSDSDGLSDAAELNTYFSLPNTSDTDGDGLTDGDEVNTYNSSPIDSDSDDDTILDGIEVRHATFGFDPAVDSSARLAELIALVEEFPGVSTDAQNNSLSLGGISLTPSGGNSFSVDFIIEQSDDLSSWTTVDTVSHSLDTSDTKKFIRVRKP